MITRREMFNAGITTALASGIAVPAQAAPPGSWEIRDGHSGKALRWADLPGRLSPANIIFLGEKHDDPETHKAEAYLLEAIHRQVGEKLTLGMEMFERDQQSVLDQHLTGKLSEEEMAKAIRLWPNYPTDYRPLVTYARERKIPVSGTNAPQRLVRMVSREGLSALTPLSEADRSLIASYVNAPVGDAYFRRFTAIIGQGHGDGKMEPEMANRFYQAQCLRDDTMAETIVRLLEQGRVVLHINGSFHSDAGLGTAARVLWRHPLKAVLQTVKIVPYRERAKWEPVKDEADILLFVPETLASEKKSGSV